MKLEDIEPKKLELLTRVLKFYGTIDEYVILKEHEDGRRYLVFAFQDGCPEENECLSWYVQPHPKTKEKYDRQYNGLVEIWKRADKSIGHIFRISAANCGGAHGCKVGAPPKECLESGVCHDDWTKEEPVKCACWYLTPIEDIDSLTFNFNLNDIQKLTEILK